MPTPPTKLVVGIWQGRCADGNIDANIARTEQVIDEASSACCDFVCLPETFLSGYGSREIIERGAMALNDRRLLDLARRAADRNITTLVGISERKAGEQIGNTQVVLDGGKVAGAYTKTMLTGGDARDMKFCINNELPVFHARGICFGIQICHDSSFPEIASTLNWKGARILFSPHYNAISREHMDEHRIRVRNNHIGVAAHFGMIVARSNVIVTDSPKGDLGYGDSAIYSSIGTPLAEAGLFTEKLIHADVAPWLAANRFYKRRELRPTLIDQWSAAAKAALAEKAT
jgi:predicted amidohydrolase